MEALPAVFRGYAGRLGLGQLRRGPRGGLGWLGGGLPGGGWDGFARLGLDGRLRLLRFLSGSGFGLSRRGAGFGGLGCSGPSGQEAHLDLVRMLFTHGRPVEFGALAGVAQFAQLPHNLREVVARVEAVGAAQVGLALEVAVVRAALTGAWRRRALAGNAQPGVFGGPRHHHGAGVLAFGAEADGLVPDAALLLVDAVVGLSVARARPRRHHENDSWGSHTGK